MMQLSAGCRLFQELFENTKGRREHHSVESTSWPACSELVARIYGSQPSLSHESQARSQLPRL
jgi:hypothetical protein